MDIIKEHLYNSARAYQKKFREAILRAVSHRKPEMMQLVFLLDIISFISFRITYMITVYIYHALLDGLGNRK